MNARQRRRTRSDRVDHGSLTVYWRHDPRFGSTRTYVVRRDRPKGKK